jgi:uncharacterized protein (DUF1330 family)
MNHQLTLIIHLHLSTTDISAFESFEREASRIMSRHGGRIERAIRIDNHTSNPEIPFEIHIVTFPDQAAFDAYRNDSETQRLAERRAQIISRTEIMSGHDVDPYR